MAKTAGDYQHYPAKAKTRETVLLAARVDIGATGAPTVATGSDPGISISRNAAGDYDVTYPAFPAEANVRFKCGIQKSATPTVFATVVAAEAPTSGTASFFTYNAAHAAATDPASGDILWIEIVGRASVNA